MPPLLVRCATCRVLLNDDLQPDSIDLPEFIPLQEVESVIDIHPSGYYIGCPHCQRELRINGKYVGKSVACKSCHKSFDLKLDALASRRLAFYAHCPHCAGDPRCTEIHGRESGLQVLQGGDSIRRDCPDLILRESCSSGLQSMEPHRGQFLPHIGFLQDLQEFLDGGPVEP